MLLRHEAPSQGAQDKFYPTRMLCASVAALALSACSTGHHRSYSYGYPPEPLPEVHPVVVEKRIIGHGPLNDRICNIRYNTGKQVTQLCEFKPPKSLKEFQKFTPGSSKFIPGGMTYGYNPLTGKTENHYRPSKTEQVPPRTQYCTINQHFSQRDGSKTGTSEDCI